MKHILAGSIVLLVLASCTPPPYVSETIDCGEGTFSMATGDKNYSAVRDCLMESFKVCSEAIGSLTTYTIEGDPITDTYHVKSATQEACTVQVVHDWSKDQFSDKSITTQQCTELSVTDDEVGLLSANNCT